MNITTPPLPLPGLDGSAPWMGEVLKTSQKACTVRDYLDWRSMKHQGVSELDPAAPHPPTHTPMEWDASPPLGLCRYIMPA